MEEIKRTLDFSRQIVFSEKAIQEVVAISSVRFKLVNFSGQKVL